MVYSVLTENWKGIQSSAREKYGSEGKIKEMTHIQQSYPQFLLRLNTRVSVGGLICVSGQVSSEGRIN